MAPVEGSEADAAGGDNRGPTGAIGTMEDILERENLKNALKRVVKNRGSAGVDGMSVENLTPSRSTGRGSSRSCLKIAANRSR